MRFPLHITTDMIKHQIRHGLQGHTRYPFVLMLEPLYTCNLACLGCSVERHTGRIEDRLTLDECLKAADDSGAPVVSLCGGEPTIYPELKELVAGIIARKRHIYLCTNGLLLDRTVYGQITPHNRLTINIHLDGLKRTHDQVCDREGVFDNALEMIKEGKRLGFRITTNTTIFKETDMDEVETLCRLLQGYHVDGMLLSPGYHYASIESDFFLAREEIHQKFQRVLDLSKRYRLTSTPMFLEFAAGLREYPCSPWSTVTYTPQGWRGPCYLIGEKYYRTFDELWQSVDWDYWESRQDPRCHNCKMHSGFEASVVRGLRNSFKDMLRMAVWNFLE